MGQKKLNKNKDNKTTTVSSPNVKKHKGDTDRSSDGGRKTASGGSTNTNNQGQEKGV
jgi:hypothetical protein